MSVDEIRKEAFIRTPRAASLAVLLLLVPSAALAAVGIAEYGSGGASSPNIKSATTQSFPFVGNMLILAWIVNTNNQTPDVPTLSGNGLTWVVASTAVWNAGKPTFLDRITLFRAMGASPTAGSVTISFS